MNDNNDKQWMNAKIWFKYISYKTIKRKHDCTGRGEIKEKEYVFYKIPVRTVIKTRIEI